MRRTEPHHAEAEPWRGSCCAWQACRDERPVRLAVDGFGGAFWARPEAYLEPDVQAGISAFPMIDPKAVAAGTERLRHELASGEWDRKYGHLRALAALDLRYRLVSAES